MEVGMHGNNIKCFCCGKTNFEVIKTADEMRFGCFGNKDKKILKCKDCSLVFMYPQWTDEEINDLYATYWSKKDFKNQKNKIKISKYLTKFLKKEEKVLEVGSGLGHNLNYLKSKGYNVIGVDKDPSVCDKKTVFNCTAGELEGKFDSLYCLHVLEHTNNPNLFVLDCLSRLKTNGKFLFEFPSLDNPLLFLYKIKDFDKFYWYPYHLFYFNKKTTKILFDKIEGIEYKIINKLDYGLINHLRWLIFKRPGNINFNIPIVDFIYKKIILALGYSDLTIVYGTKLN